MRRAFCTLASVQQRSIAASAVWQIASQGMMAALSVVATKFVAIALSKELTGTYNSAFGFLQIFGIVADFGLYAVAVREIARAADRSRVLGAIIVLRSAILVLSLTIALAVVWLLPQWRATPFPLAVSIAAFVPFFTLLAGILRTVFQVQYKLQFVFIAETLQRVVTTVLIGAFVWAGFRGTDETWVLYAFLWIGGAGALVLWLLSLFYATRLMRVRPTLDLPLIRHLLSLAVPYGVAYLCMALYRQMDVLFIALLRDDFALQNAYYGMTVRVADMAFLIPTFILNSILPIISERTDDSAVIRGIVSKTLFVIILVNGVFALFSFFWAKPLTLLLSTPAYLATADHPGTDQAFALMSMPMFLNGLVLYSFYLLLAHDAWRRLAGTLAVGAAVSVTLNVLLVPIHGFFGTLTSLIVVHVLLVALLLPQALRLQRVRLTWAHLRALLTVCLPLPPLLWLLAPHMTDLPRILGGGAAACIVLVGLAWLGGLRRVLSPR